MLATRENRIQRHSWIPTGATGGLQAVWSTLRICYLTSCVILEAEFRNADVVVLDVLPTSLPLLQYFLPSAGRLFHCHFPDKLLVRARGSSVTEDSDYRGVGSLRDAYRNLLDAVEDRTMYCADTLCVNSKFTLSQVRRAFPSLRRTEMDVLYPALDMTGVSEEEETEPKTLRSPIVSLNRFERKKNIELLLHAYGYVKTKLRESNDGIRAPPIIVAGGYDVQNAENVEYRK